MTSSEIGFTLFSTAGNTTLFVDHPDCANSAMKIISCEQAGYAAAQRVVMAGGEFCANACLAFAALSQMEGFGSLHMQMAGITVEVSCKGELPQWDCTATFPTEGCTISPDRCVVHLSGISHAFIPGEPPESSSIFVEAARLREVYNLAEKPAAGITWWHMEDAVISITPVISVKQAGTCNLEAACGSASLGLALCLGNGSFDFLQPSGAILTVSNRNKSLTLTGPVSLEARGVIWL